MFSCIACDQTLVWVCGHVCTASHGLTVGRAHLRKRRVGLTKSLGLGVGQVWVWIPSVRLPSQRAWDKQVRLPESVPLAGNRVSASPPPPWGVRVLGHCPSPFPAGAQCLEAL